MMIRRILVLALFAVTLGVVEPSAAMPAGPRCGTAEGAAGSARPFVTVGSFNVLHGLTENPPAYPAHSTLDQRVDLAAAAIDAAAVDVVGLQEVTLVEPNPPGSDNPTLHETTDVAAAIAERLAARSKERWHWCWWLADPYVTGEPDVNEGGGGPLSDEAARLASPRYASFKEGLAILSRYPILEAEGIHLPGRVLAEMPLCLTTDDPSGCALVAGSEGRAALWARIDSPVGPIDVTNTHLGHDSTGLSDAGSLEQALAVMAFAEAKGAVGSPVHQFLVCDCNAQPSDPVPVIEVIESGAWLQAFRGDCATAPTFCTAGTDAVATTGPQRALDERLDYVFFRPGCNVNLRIGRFADEPARQDDGTYLWPSDHAGVFGGVSACAD